MAKLLIAYDTTEVQTRRIAQHVAGGQLRAARPRLALGIAQLQFVRRVAGRLLPSGGSASTAQAADSSDRD